MRRTLALWLLLFGVYAATVGLDAFDRSDYGGDEPHYLLAAESLVEDGDVDVLDEYASRAYADFYPHELEPHGRETEGRLNEPHGVGFPLLIAPAWALGGETAVELFLAAIAALAMALAYRLGLRVAPDPWALGAALAVGLSPPLLAYGSAVYPELSAAAALAGAALLALRLDERVSRRDAFACFVLLGSLPWLGTKFVAAGVVIGAFAARSIWRSRRRTLAVGAVELSLFSVAIYVGINEAVYGGPTPYAADVAGETATDADFPGGYLERAYRLVALFVDRNYGLLRWAPVFLLAFAGLWWLWRSRRDGLARAVPGVRAIEVAAGLCAAALGAQLLVAAFGAPTMFGFWFPPRHLLAGLPLAVPLVAWALRHHPRVGIALAALTLAASAWLYADVRWGGGSLVTDRPDAPFGPLTDAWPLFEPGGGWPYWLAGAIGVALALLAVREARAARHSRQVLRIADEGATARATPVADRHLHRLDARAPERQREDLRVVVVVRDARLRESARREGAEARLGVARDRLREEAEQRARGAVRERSVPAHPLALAEEARAEHVVRPPAGDRLEHVLEAGGVVLAVAVDVDRRGVALVAGDLEAGAERGAKPARARVRVHARTVRATDVRSGVGGAVVDEQDVNREPGRLAGQTGEHRGQRRSLITRNNHRENAPRRRFHFP